MLAKARRTMNKFRKIALIILISVAAASLMLLASCGESASEPRGVKITFELEGGTFRNNRPGTPIEHYYVFPEGVPHLIRRPDEIKQGVEPVTKQGCVLEGWFRTRTQATGADGNPATDADGNPVYEYSDEWNFETDVVEGNELTLYAKWNNAYTNSFALYYFSSGSEVQARTVTVTEDNPEFSHWKERFDRVRMTGYTAMKHKDPATGNSAITYYIPVEFATWDYTDADVRYIPDETDPNRVECVEMPADYVHPVGVEGYQPTGDLEVKIYVDVLPGDWMFVSNKGEFGTTLNANIYLLDDVDLGNAEIGAPTEYRYRFIGNGKTVSNFTVRVNSGMNNLVEIGEFGSNNLAVSLFGRLMQGTEVRDVTFDNVTFLLETTNSMISNIVVAPLALDAAGVSETDKPTLGGVTVNGKVQVNRLPNGFDKDNRFADYSAQGIYDGELIESQDCTCNVTVEFGEGV